MDPDGTDHTMVLGVWNNVRHLEGHYPATDDWAGEGGLLRQPTSGPGRIWIQQEGGFGGGDGEG